MIAGATLVVAVMLFSSLGKPALPAQSGLKVFGALGLLIGGVVIAVAFGTADQDSGSSGRIGTGDTDWSDAMRVSSSLSQAQTAVPAAMQAPSVPELLSGLERRLETDPDDPGGWALLAQSYAFVGEPERAEDAIGRAVELGFDEGELRQLVASARRDPHAGLAAFGADAQ
jgi:cytochrome c-type biogenesis protein CcmH/NrfG